MCILIYKPAGVAFTDINTLEKCWDANPDGAGFAVLKNKIHVVKGLMNFDEFLKAYSALYDKNNDIIIHFRLASKGPVVKELTHPFVIDKTQPPSLEFITNKPILFHNGTIPNLGKDGKSDTLEFAELLAKISENTWDKVISTVRRTDKFIIAKQGEVKLYGDFEIIDQVYFSNLSWQFNRGINTIKFLEVLYKRKR